MLELYAALAGLIFALLAFGLSTVSLLVHWQRRAESPYTAHIEREVAELSETLHAFMKRHAARQRRAAQEAREQDQEENAAPGPSDEAASPNISLVPPHLQARLRDKVG